MIRFWIGTALLAASWLFGLSYFYPASPVVWLIAVVAAIVLLGDASETSENSQPAKKSAAVWIPIVLLAPAVWFAVWPYRIAPLLLMLGLAVRWQPVRRRWTAWAASGMIAAGAALLVQSLALELYATQTSHAHELPYPLPDVLAAILSVFGITASADGPSIILQTMRQTHRLAATWELLFDPATWLFFFGGLTVLGVKLAASSDRGWAIWLAGLRRLTLIVVLWLPFRAMLLVALYLHRVVQFDPDQPLHAMNHFFSPWSLSLLLIAPMLLAWRFVRGEGRGARGEGAEGQGELETEKLEEKPLENLQVSSTPSLPDSESPRLLISSSACIAAAVAIFTVAIYWCPSGPVKGDRVMWVERHSHWSPTTKPYDTKWFVEPKLTDEGDEGSGYNYARIYRYLGQFFKMSRLLTADAIDAKTLAQCDVLVLKLPTERYSPEEAAAVTQFVHDGGGLLLIGDHTNFKQSSTAMNDITRPMGFIFRNDLLFSFGGSPYDQLFIKPTLAHPALKYLTAMDFAVSCSIDPGWSHGREVITSTGLWSMGPDYHFDNFHPIPQHCPEMQAGAFVQSWAADYGRGRVIAFADSTVFSNFCVGQPGKTELMLGIVDWLRHSQPICDSRLWLILLGLVPCAVVVRFGFSRRRTSDDATQNADGGSRWMLWTSAGLCGWALASTVVWASEHWRVGADLHCTNPQRSIVIDRTTSTVPLSNGPYTTGGGTGFGMFEQWLARLDCTTVRRENDAAFSGDVLVVIAPSRSVSESYRQRLEQYVSAGGKLLVLDGPDNGLSTAGELLAPFGLSIRHETTISGMLAAGLKNFPKVDVAAACEVVGGQPVARAGATTVAAVVKHGRGSVMAIGCGSLWNDMGMGETWKTGRAGGDSPRRDGQAEAPGWMLEPNAVVRARYDAMFGLLGNFIDGADWPAVPVYKPTSKAGKHEFEPKESGPAEL